MKVLALLVCIMLPTYTLAFSTTFYDILIKCGQPQRNACSSYCQLDGDGWNTFKGETDLVNSCVAGNQDKNKFDHYQSTCNLNTNNHDCNSQSTCDALEGACKALEGYFVPL